MLNQSSQYLTIYPFNDISLARKGFGGARAVSELVWSITIPHPLQARDEVMSLTGYMGGRNFDQKPPVEIEVYLSQFWVPRLGPRLFLGFPHVFDLNLPKNSPSLPL